MTVTVDVTLSNGEKVKVKRLGLFEIQDNIGLPNLEPYTITGEVNGKQYRQVYILDYERPKPDTPFEMCQRDSMEYWDWIEYHNWQDGLVYLEAQNQSLIDHLQAVDDYIKRNCISADDLAKVTSFDDWDMVKAAAISELTLSDLVQYANAIYQAQYKDKPLFDAYQGIEKASGSYNWITQLEYGLLKELGGIEEKYIAIPKKDRARMILSELVPEMIKTLDMRDQAKEAEKARGRNGNV